MRDLNSPQFLLGHWPLNSNAKDVIRGNDGTWSGTEAYVETDTGKTIADFTALDNMITASLSNAPIGNEITFALTLNVKGLGATPTTADGILRLKKDSVSHPIFYVDYLNGNFRQVTYNDAGSYKVNYQTAYNKENQFVRVVGILTASKVELWFNGELMDSEAPVSGTLKISDLNKMRLSDSEAPSGAGQFNGYIGDVKVWNIALTGDEVLRDLKDSRRVQK